MIDAEVHRPSQPHALRTKFSLIFRPFLGVTCGIEHRSIFIFVCHCCVRGAFGPSDFRRNQQDFNHFVTVVHPNVLSCLKGQREKCRFTCYRATAVAAATQLSRRCYFTAKLLSHRLHAAADTEDRNTWIKYVLRCTWEFSSVTLSGHQIDDTVWINSRISASSTSQLQSSQ